MSLANIVTAFNALILKIENNFQRLENNKADTNHTHANVLTVSDIATSVSANSTNTKPVGAKLLYDTLGNIETLLQGV